MPTKVNIAWTFAILIIDVVIMFLFPKPLIIFFGVLLLPILIIFQTYAILKEKNQRKQEFSEDQWYQH